MNTKGLIKVLSVAVCAFALAVCLVACGPSTITTTVQKTEVINDSTGAKIVLTVPADNFKGVSLNLTDFPVCTLDSAMYNMSDAVQEGQTLLLTYAIPTSPTTVTNVSFSEDKAVIYAGVDTKAIVDGFSTPTSTGSPVSIPDTTISSHSSIPLDTSTSDAANSTEGSASQSASSASQSSASASSASVESSSSSAAVEPSSSSSSAAAVNPDVVSVSEDVLASVTSQCQGIYKVIFNTPIELTFGDTTIGGDGMYHVSGTYAAGNKEGDVEVTFSGSSYLKSFKVDGKEMLD